MERYEDGNGVYPHQFLRETQSNTPVPPSAFLH